MASKSIVPFKIKDNVLIGEEDCINIGELVLNAFKSKPDFIGQVDAKTGEKNTFQQMRERSIKCALWLKKFGVRRNDIVTVCTSNHLDTYIPYLATLYIGAILSVWHEYRTINLRYYIQSNPKVIFTDIDKAPLILNVAKIMKVSTKIVIFKNKSEKEKQFTSIKCILNTNFKDEIDKFSCTKLESSKDTAVILFSSSTVGYIRKHVAIPHAFFTSSLNQQIPFMLPDDVGLWVESLHWNISLLLTVRCILSYVKAVKINEFLNPSREECFCDIIQKYKVNWVFLKCGMGEQFSNFEVFKKYDVSSLMQVVITIRTTSTRLIEKFMEALPNAFVTLAYCLPETGIITFHQKGEPSYVHKNVSLFFADLNNSSPLPPHQCGFIRGPQSPSLTNGYFNSTTGDIIAATDDNGWFHTDEIGGFESDIIYILERGKEGNILTFKAYHFSPLMIELTLHMHPEIRDVAVVPIYIDEDNHHPMALVIRKEGSKVTEEEIINFVADKRINDCMQLHAGVLFVRTLPYFRSRHLDRKKIYELVREHVFNPKNNLINL